MLGHQTDSTATVWLLIKGIPHAASPMGETAKFEMPSSPELELMLTDLKSKGYDKVKYKVQDRIQLRKDWHYTRRTRKNHA